MKTAYDLYKNTTKIAKELSEKIKESKQMEKVKISEEQARKMILEAGYNHSMGFKEILVEKTIIEWRELGYIEMTEFEEAQKDFYSLYNIDVNSHFSLPPQVDRYIDALEKEVERLKK